MKILNENVSKNIIRSLNESSQTTQRINDILQNLADVVVTSYNELKEINATNNNGIDDIGQDEVNRLIGIIENFMENMENS